VNGSLETHFNAILEVNENLANNAIHVIVTAGQDHASILSDGMISAM
jgi:hypothetical protein